MFIYKIAEGDFTEARQLGQTSFYGRTYAVKSNSGPASSRHMGKLDATSASIRGCKGAMRKADMVYFHAIVRFCDQAAHQPDDCGGWAW